MAAKKTTLEELGEMLSHVVKHIAAIREEMATKKDLEKVETKLLAFRSETAENFREVKAEVADIRRDLEALKERIGYMSGYSKEIDHALARIARIARIEKHLGIEARLGP